MAFHQAVIYAIADLAHIAITVIAKKMGHSEIEVKKVEKYIFWLLTSAFTVFLLVLTFKYS